jgi:hypothetical protein
MSHEKAQKTQKFFPEFGTGFFHDFSFVIFVPFCG